MANAVYDAIVVGGGQAGLSISYFLTDRGMNHLVLERGQIGHSWRTQRWDSFRLNSPNKVNLLPGMKNGESDPDGFSSASDFASHLVDYAVSHTLPVRELCEVVSLEKDAGHFTVRASSPTSESVMRSRNVVIASGGYSEMSTPSFARKVDPAIHQLHTAQYRSAAKLPEGGVLVVGSAQSGTQVAEDLIASGRKVFISTSKVGRVPRRYRGKDIVEWLNAAGFYDQKTDDISDPTFFSLKPPQVSGVGPRGHTTSLQALARSGAAILGKAFDADGQRIFLRPDAAANVRFADAFSLRAKSMIDAHIASAGIVAPAAEIDPADVPDENASCASADVMLDLRDRDISTIIWTTGFTGNFGYLRLPVFHDDGTIKHSHGISDLVGLYFLGLPWLRSRKSAVIWGMAEDAGFIAEHLSGRHI